MSHDISGPSQSTLSANGGEQQAMSAPLGTGDFIGEMNMDPLSGSEPAKKINSSALLIGAVILISVAGLFSMRKLAQVTAAAAVDGEIEQTIIAFIDSVKGPKDGAETREEADAERRNVLAVLGAAYSERQVPLDDVKRNPFIIDTPAETIEPVVVEDPDELNRRQKLEYQRKQRERRAQLERCEREMRLKSIMGGSSPLAIVNDKVVRVGDVIPVPGEEAEFTVESITAGTVTVVGVAPELNVQVTISLVLNRDQ